MQTIRPRSTRAQDDFTVPDNFHCTPRPNFDLFSAMSDHVETKTFNLRMAE